jgi:internalin A
VSERLGEERREVFLSYAWGDEHSEKGRQRERVVEQLCARLEADGYRVLRDRTTMRRGELISGFMLRIGRGDRIVAVLSEKYLRSPFCMNEFHLIYQHACGQKVDFLQKLVPLVLEDARIDDWRTRAEWARYWEQEYLKMEQDLRYLGAGDFGTYLLMKRWYVDVGTMLEYVSDKLAPRVLSANEDEAIAAVLEMLAERA